MISMTTQTHNWITGRLREIFTSNDIIYADCPIITMETTASAFNISHIITSPLEVPTATHSTGFVDCDFLYAQKWEQVNIIIIISLLPHTSIFTRGTHTFLPPDG